MNLEISLMWKWISDLYPICRSITRDGVRETLNYVQRIIPELKICKVQSGTKVFDWTIPEEWNIRDAWLKDSQGNVILEFNKNNLHVVGYSTPIDKIVDYEELQKHLYSLPDQANAIPYVTSYYNKHWGFCLEHSKRELLKPGKYHAYIDSDIKPGFLNYGEILIPGESDKEIFLSTYICHPSMANNELSGPVVTMGLACWIKSLKKREYSYRIIFIPETIGSIAYLSINLEQMKKNIVAGYNISCVGDDNRYTYLPSRKGNTISDRVAKHVLSHIDPNFTELTWLDRGSDERQYCSPGIDLPIASIMRSAYGTYPQYHTSEDNLEFVSPSGLMGGLNALKKAIECIELNCHPITSVLGEPQLGRRGLYPLISYKNSSNGYELLLDIISLCDGTNDLIMIAENLKCPAKEIFFYLKNLEKNDIIKINYNRE